MRITKATGSNNKFKEADSSTKTDDDSKNKSKSFDLSNGGPIWHLTTSQIIAAVIFIFGLGWFVAAEWHFEIQTTSFKSELDEKNNLFKAGYDLNLNNQGKRIDELQNQLDNLKIRNPYLK